MDPSQFSSAEGGLGFNERFEWLSACPSHFWCHDSLGVSMWGDSEIKESHPFVLLMDH